MMSDTLLQTTVVGSYPQPDWLVDRALLAKGVPRTRLRELWRVQDPWLQQAQDDATLLAIRDMERGGQVDIPVKDIAEPAFRHGQGGDREIGDAAAEAEPDQAADVMAIQIWAASDAAWGRPRRWRLAMIEEILEGPDALADGSIRDATATACSGAPANAGRFARRFPKRLFHKAHCSVPRVRSAGFNFSPVRPLTAVIVRAPERNARHCALHGEKPGGRPCRFTNAGH